MPDPEDWRLRRGQYAAANARPETADDTPSGWLQFGFAIFMVFEVVLAMIFGGWLGAVVAGCFTGVWHAVLFWIVSMVGTAFAWGSFLVGFGCLFNFLRRDEVPKTRYEKDGPHIS